MIAIQHRCPRCINMTAFHLAAVDQYSMGLTPEQIEKRQERRRGSQTSVRIIQPDEKTRFFGSASCGVCEGTVVFVMEADRPTFTKCRTGARLPEYRPEFLPGEFRIIETLPAAPDFNAHPSWPEKAAKPFAEVREDMRRNRDPSRIITACRSVLDVAARDLGGHGETLFNRIEDLKSQGILTAALADWAHNLRRTANLAVHEFEGSPEDAAALVSFTETFLKLCYEIPEEIEKRRREISKPAE